MFEVLGRGAGEPPDPEILYCSLAFIVVSDVYSIVLLLPMICSTASCQMFNLEKWAQPLADGEPFPKRL